MKLTIMFLAVVAVTGKEERLINEERRKVDNLEFYAYPCEGNDNISIVFRQGLPPGEQNQYDVIVYKQLQKFSRIEIYFDSGAIVNLSNDTASRGRSSPYYGHFRIGLLQPADFIGFTVKGRPWGKVPYLRSIKINSQEYCEHPKTGFLDRYIEGYNDTAKVHLTVPNGCGRRKIKHTELIVSGEATKPGDWPWHAAIYQLNGQNIKYIAGGTLLSKIFVLTAAHCITIRGAAVTPDSLSVVLGKYNLIGGDIDSQEREVFSVIPHEEFALREYLKNDIGLLKLKAEAVFNDYVQPACIWNENVYDRLPTNRDIGTVVGWGFDQTDTLSCHLKQATMPRISDATCIKKNPVFYGTVLNNDKKFCAGWANGTSACNGDSGGGYVVFVPDEPKDESPNAAGAWYVRGIVSLSASRKDAAICDPLQYIVFTDIANYTSWIKKHLS